MARHAVKVGPGGRIVIPLNFRDQLAIKPGDTILLETDGDTVRITSMRQAIRNAQELVASYVQADRSLAAELIAEQRTAAQRE